MDARKSGSGKTAGSVSFATVKVRDLVKLGMDTDIPVSIRFCRLLNIPHKATCLTTKEVKQLAAPKVDVVAEKLE